MNYQESPFLGVREREVQGEIFQVTHRILQIPRSTYLNVLGQHEEPFSEMGAQQFVEENLKWCGDRGGVIGMVRFDEQDGEIVLDAAVRYRINPLTRPSCHT